MKILARSEYKLVSGAAFHSVAYPPLSFVLIDGTGKDLNWVTPTRLAVLGIMGDNLELWYEQILNLLIMEVLESGPQPGPAH